MPAESALDYIFSFDRKGAKVSDLSRMRSLLALIGNPERELSFIHVAGTNGKGSVCEYLSEILTKSGVKTGLFTSPYLSVYNDRIRLCGRNIENTRLEQIVRRLKPLLDGFAQKDALSQFEVTTAIAFTYFKEEQAQAVVLETGIGGLLDCTNVIEKPLVSIITNIALDHTAILGDTLEKIARQKAGIIKKNCPVILGGNVPLAARKVVAAECRRKNAPLYMADKHKLRVISSDISGSVFCYENNPYKILMAGTHQIENALCALLCCRLLQENFALTQKSISEGLATATLPGRIQIIGSDPLTILDGGHNPDGTLALSRVLKNLPKPIVAVIGMHADKSIGDAVKNLIGEVSEFITVDSFSGLDCSKEQLAAVITSLGGKATPGSGDILNDIGYARSLCGNGTAIVCGSLYLAAKVMTDDSSK